ncbi:hypothetical protein B6K86_09150 [Lachnospiraceae bacterium]|nr:hypothetical protein B6K86_09150 [Lachnospiraceae bacterium]
MRNIIWYLSKNPLYILLFIAGIVALVLLLLIQHRSGEKDKKNIRKKERNGEQLSPRQKSANAIVNVLDVDDYFLYTKDGYLIGFLRIGNINIELLSREELNTMTQRLAMSFEGDRQNFDYFTLPSQVNLDPNKDFLKEKHQATDDLGKRKGLNLMLQELTILSTSGENFEHQHFIRIWKKIGTNIKDTQNELTIRLGEFRDRYVQAGISCEILRGKDIIKLCNLFGNPQQAPFTGSNISRYESFPILDKGLGEWLKK